MAKKNTGSAAVAEPTPAPVKVEDVGPCRKKLTFEIGAARIAELISEKFDDLSGGVQLPGFRPGRAPRNLVERRFGAHVREEVKQQAVAEAYEGALKERELRVLGDPEGGDELKDAVLDGRTPLKFSLEVEVAPEITLPSLDGMEVMKPRFEVTDEMVAHEVERLATNDGALESRESADHGDYCVGRGVMKNNKDETVLDIPGAVIQVPKKGDDGDGMILGVKVDDFAKQIGKPKPGDTLHVKTEGPENHENESVRGKPITIEFKVDEVHRIIPAKVEDLVRRYGMESEEQLREQLRVRLEQRVMIEQQSAMRQQIARRLLDTVKVELPERVTARQAARNLERHRLDLMHRGVEPRVVEEHIAESRASTTEVAVRELKLFFILDKVATDQQVQVSEQEVNGRIAQIAASRGERPEQMRAALINSGQINGVVQQIREHKALDALLAKAKVDEVSVDDFNKAMKKRQA